MCSIVSICSVLCVVYMVAEFYMVAFGDDVCDAVCVVCSVVSPRYIVSNQYESRDSSVL